MFFNSLYSPKNSQVQATIKARLEVKKEQKALEKKYGKEKAKEMSEAKLKDVMQRLENEEQEILR